jgi:hypothetical protein
MTTIINGTSLLVSKYKVSTQEIHLPDDKVRIFAKLPERELANLLRKRPSEICLDWKTYSANCGLRNLTQVSDDTNPQIYVGQRTANDSVNQSIADQIESLVDQVNSWTQLNVNLTTPIVVERTILEPRRIGQPGLESNKTGRVLLTKTYTINLVDGSFGNELKLVNGSFATQLIKDLVTNILVFGNLNLTTSEWNISFLASNASENNSFTLPN